MLVNERAREDIESIVIDENGEFGIITDYNMLKGRFKVMRYDRRKQISRE